MEELTCTNCNCDVDEAELKSNNLRCPTCGFDMSDANDKDILDEEEGDEDEDAVDKSTEDDEDEDEDEE